MKSREQCCSSPLPPTPVPLSSALHGFQSCSPPLDGNERLEKQAETPQGVLQTWALQQETDRHVGHRAAFPVSPATQDSIP